jgi:tripartite-type tricarboxylate transporter receptor subunit TctC
MQTVLSKDAVKKRLEGIGAVANLSTPSDFTKVIQSDIKTFQDVAKTAGLEAK